MCAQAERFRFSARAMKVSTMLSGLIERFGTACDGFARRLTLVQPEQWTWSTPCPEWSVRQLVNHVAQGNLNLPAKRATNAVTT